MEEIQKIKGLLEALEIPFEAVTHQPVFTIEEMAALKLPKEKCVAKNLFIRDDKKQNYYLFVVHQDKRADLKRMREKLGSRPLTFASEEDLNRLLGLTKGAVTPFGIINDEAHRVKVCIDTVFERSCIGVHPNVNTATFWLKTSDLIRFIEHHGNQTECIDF